MKSIIEQFNHGSLTIFDVVRIANECWEETKGYDVNVLSDKNIKKEVADYYYNNPEEIRNASWIMEDMQNSHNGEEKQEVDDKDKFISNTDSSNPYVNTREETPVMNYDDFQYDPNHVSILGVEDNQNRNDHDDLEH